ncbi:MAG TPA: prenyltransferase/squalene oxidase repeat-containing protein [Solirubrobacteraceae bacterium]|jgi:energy-coupling factor transport system substrate-specific component
MSWQLAAYGLLFVALAGGFAWYERRRPDARVVALVATLAALAALGRIAFAALPNVKPTTDIVLVAGYALGAGPGFAVGAVAGLTSNFFFGQGPWTPWQMAGWGAAGLVGAGLAVLTRRRLNRWTLALVCTVVGFAFTVLQDVGDWVTYSDHSLAALGVYVGQGLGFDAVHAAGCLVFALAFGPALARSLSRFATRIDVTWLAPGPAVVPIVAALTVGGWLAGQARSASSASAASSPLSYLLAAQNSDGGFGPAPGRASSQLYSGWAAMGLAAAGVNPQDAARGGSALTSYLALGASGQTDPGSLERVILAVRAAGLSATSFGGRNLVAALEHDIGRNGSVSDQTNWTAFAVLALRATGISAPGPAVHWLIRQQDSDGGFNFSTAGGSSDVDDTGAVVEALARIPGRAARSARSRAVRYIDHQQNRDGGFAATAGASSNAQSTAWAIQGLIAAGADPSSLHRVGAPSPPDYLRSLEASDGHIRYSRSSDQTPVWVTAEAIMALDGRALPIVAPARSRPQAKTPMVAPPRPATRARPGSAPPHHRRHHGRATRSRSYAPGGPPAQGPIRFLGLIDALVLIPVGLG